jgi:hypothetical protein
MLSCFGARSAPRKPKRTLSKADARSAKKQLKLKTKISQHTSTYGRQTLGFSFSGAGFLFPYFAGVCSSLVQLGIIKNGSHLAGASAGSLMAANVNSGMSPEKGLEGCLAFAADCRENGSKGRLKQALRSYLDSIMPADAHIQASGNTYVAVTQAVPLKSRLVSHWDTRDEFLDCLVASCHLPRYSDKNLTSNFHGKGHMDGGVLNFVPVIPRPNVFTVGVCCFPAKYISKMPMLNKNSILRNLAICPDMFEPASWRYTLKQLMQYAFEPGPDAFLCELNERGRRDACLWALSMALIPQSPTTDLVLRIDSHSPGASSVDAPAHDPGVLRVESPSRHPPGGAGADAPSTAGADGPGPKHGLHAAGGGSSELLAYHPGAAGLNPFSSTPTSSVNSVSGTPYHDSLDVASALSADAEADGQRGAGGGGAAGAPGPLHDQVILEELGSAGGAADSCLSVHSRPCKLHEQQLPTAAAGVM